MTKSLCTIIGFLWVFSLPLRADEPRNVNLRGTFQNARIKFDRQKTGHAAFMGGSITEMNGYRPMVCEMLKRRFPDTRFTFTDAGIASTCSTTGAFRLQRDVLKQGPVDLFFVEFAVNDDQDAQHARRDCLRGMEGIVRQCRRHNPRADIVVVHFCNPGMIETLTLGKTPLSVAAHEAVAEHYKIPSIHVAGEVARRIAEGKLTWKQYGGTHPAPRGNRLAADMAGALFDAAWKEPLAEKTAMKDHPLPEKPLDVKSYENGRFVAPKLAKADDGWKLHVPDWKSLPGNCRERFLKQQLLCADSEGAQLKLDFEGTAIGAYVLAGPDAGTVEASVDGSPFKTIDLYHRFSAGLHYPRTVMFAADLADGKHTLTLRVSKTNNPKSQGRAVRILQFAAN